MNNLAYLSEHLFIAIPIALGALITLWTMIHLIKRNHAKLAYPVRRGKGLVSTGEFVDGQIIEVRFSKSEKSFYLLPPKNAETNSQ